MILSSHHKGLNVLNFGGGKMQKLLFCGVFWAWASGLAVATNATPHQCFADPKAAYAYLLAGSQTHKKININTASAAELTTLHGVGVKTAEAIVQYRTQMGRFRQVEDLMNVKGVGEKTLENNRQRLSVDE